MKKNIGTKDRILRLITALVLFGLACWQMSILLLCVAAFVLFESLFSWCIFYALIGKSSCPISKTHEKNPDDSHRP